MSRHSVLCRDREALYRTATRSGAHDRGALLRQRILYRDRLKKDLEIWDVTNVKCMDVKN